MSPVGKIVFSFIGIYYMGLIGLFAGFIVGHICVDENEIVKKFVDKHPYLRKLLSEFSKIRIKIPVSILEIFEAGKKYRGNPFETAANLREARDVAFVQSVAGLIAAISESNMDSEGYKKELDIFYRSFVIPPYMINQFKQIFDGARSKNSPFDFYARQIKMILEGNPVIKDDVLRILFQVAHIDGKLSSKELDLLRRVSVLLGIPNSSFAKVSEEFDKNDSKKENHRPFAPAFSKDPYRILGVDKSLSDEEIKKVYRDLIRTNHPDTLMAEGASKQEVDAANRFMAEINAAYDLIERERRK